MDSHLADDQLPAQILMPPESTLHLQLVVMDKHLLDDELAAQFMMPAESDLLLQNAGNGAQYVHALPAQPMMPHRFATLKAARNRQQSGHHKSEVFVRSEIECPGNLAAIGEANRQRSGIVGLNS
jgi:hypothetical protein